MGEHVLRGALPSRTPVLTWVAPSQNTSVPSQPNCVSTCTHTHTSKKERFAGPLQRSEVEREQELSSKMLGPLRTSALFGARMTGLDTWLRVTLSILLRSQPHSPSWHLCNKHSLCDRAQASLFSHLSKGGNNSNLSHW